jgi:hypothetical protein
MSERPPDPFRPGEVPAGPSTARNVGVILGVTLLALVVIVLIWALAR